MLLRIIIYINLFLITNLSLSMELIKKITGHHKTTDNNNPIDMALLFAHTATAEKRLVKDITRHILQYCINLKYNDFLNNSIKFRQKWFNNKISTEYFYLTKKQNNIMIKLLKTEVSIFMAYPVTYFFVKSQKKYKEFLTIPFNLRKNLTLSSFGDITTVIQVTTIQAQLAKRTYHKINNSQFLGSIPKPALPEESFLLLKD